MPKSRILRRHRQDAMFDGFTSRWTIPRRERVQVLLRSEPRSEAPRRTSVDAGPPAPQRFTLVERHRNKQLTILVFARFKIVHTFGWSTGAAARASAMNMDLARGSAPNPARGISAQPGGQPLVSSLVDNRHSAPADGFFHAVMGHDPTGPLRDSFKSPDAWRCHQQAQAVHHALGVVGHEQRVPLLVSARNCWRSGHRRAPPARGGALDRVSQHLLDVVPACRRHRFEHVSSGLTLEARD